MIKNTIKLADAISQGYTYFGISDLSEFQVARDLNIQELERAASQYPDHRMQLFTKDGSTPSGIDESALRDIVEDHMKCQYMDESGNDDDSDVAAALRAVDFAAFAKAIKRGYGNYAEVLYFRWSVCSPIAATTANHKHRTKTTNHETRPILHVACYADAYAV